MSKKIKVIVVTGNRADYGLLYWTLKELKNSKKFTLKLVVTGSHLSNKHGLTMNQIIKDKFKISKKIKLDLKLDGEKDISNSLAIGIKKFSIYFEKQRPDLILILGDRYETFASAVAAYISRIPIAHVHGGETTRGAFDEAFRHSITKMSHLHFTTTDIYKKRVIQLGEAPNTVLSVGAPGIENIKRIKLFKLEDLESEINFQFNKRNLLITYHPVTLENHTTKYQIKNLLASLDKLKNTNLIFTKSNVDTGGSTINNTIKVYVESNKNKAILFSSLGSKRYLSILKYVDGIVGNSSSGIIEAPSLRVGTVNIGDRQLGRVQAASIINTSNSEKDITKAIKKLYTKKYTDLLLKVINPYGSGNVAKKIVNKIVHTDFTKLIKKKFHDI
tara:strand:+ start:3711 stop:4874 length:1164 start_codon:yes stop_codon:yes gene_type:complete